MMRFVPHNNAIALTIAPMVWLAYFVITFLISAVGCERGWYEVAFAGTNPLRVALALTAVAGFALIAFAAWQSYSNLRTAQDPQQPWEPEERERRSFLARTGLFLSGISLLGTLWGAINIFIFAGCEE